MNICIKLSGKFLSFYEEIIVFCFILFCRTRYDSLCSVEINTASDLVSRLYEGALL